MSVCPRTLTHTLSLSDRMEYNVSFFRFFLNLQYFCTLHSIEDKNKL